MKLSVKQLPDYFSVHGIRTLWKMANFIAPVFTAVELRFQIIKSTKTQLKNKFSEIGIPDRMVVEKIKSLDGEIK